jgi:hypothetical protein
MRETVPTISCFPYAGGNLQIINLCYQFLGVWPDLIHEAFLDDHLSTLLSLVACLQEPYWLPPITGIESRVVEVFDEKLHPLESRVWTSDLRWAFSALRGNAIASSKSRRWTSCERASLF